MMEPGIVISRMNLSISRLVAFGFFFPFDDLEPYAPGGSVVRSEDGHQLAVVQVQQHLVDFRSPLKCSHGLPSRIHSKHETHRITAIYLKCADEDILNKARTILQRYAEEALTFSVLRRQSTLPGGLEEWLNNATTPANPAQAGPTMTSSWTA